MNEIHISYPAIQEIAAKGVRRTAVFIGLGLNAALDPNFKAYELTQITSIQLVPPDADEKTLSHYKEQFSLWITACGLRELMETFAVFLDEVHQASLLIAASSRKILTNDIAIQDKKYRQKGIKEKLDLLKQNFNIESKNPEALKTIHQTRNCLTHRQGIVGTEDCFGGQNLNVKWMGLDIYAETPSGEIVPLQPVPKEGIFLPEGGRVKVKLLERLKTFPLRTLVTFSPRDLAEICHFVLLSTGEIIGSAEAYARREGIPMSTTSDA